MAPDIARPVGGAARMGQGRLDQGVAGLARFGTRSGLGSHGRGCGKAKNGGKQDCQSAHRGSPFSRRRAI
jgi:hypothetical protein